MGTARGRRWGCGVHPHLSQIAQRLGDFVPDEPLFQKLPSRCTSTRPSRSGHDIVVTLAVLQPIVFLSPTSGLTRPPCARTLAKFSLFGYPEPSKGYNIISPDDRRPTTTWEHRTRSSLTTVSPTSSNPDCPPAQISGLKNTAYKSRQATNVRYYQLVTPQVRAAPPNPEAFKGAVVGT